MKSCQLEPYNDACRKSSSPDHRLRIWLVLLLFSSVADIAFLTYNRLDALTHEGSKYDTLLFNILFSDLTPWTANLQANLAIRFEWVADYASPNLNESGKIWDSISFNAGMVALPCQ